MAVQKSHLRTFWPINGTPYIFCEVRKALNATHPPLQVRYSNLIIDLRKGRCILRVDWQDMQAVPNSGRQNSRQTENKGVLVDRDELNLIYEQISRFESSSFSRREEEKKNSNSYMKKRRDLWRIDLHGGAQKIENPPDYLIQNQSSYRCLNYSSLVAIASDRLIQYQLNGNDLQASEDWVEIGDALVSLCDLPNQGYLFSNTRKGVVVFLQAKEPRVRTFPIQSLIADLPAPPREGTPWETFSRLSWQMIPLSVSGNSTLLAYLQMPGFPIFEIHLDRLSRGTGKEIFSFLGFSPSCRPFLSMRDNRAIFFTNSLVRRGHERSTNVPLFVLEKQANGWPTEGGFVFQPQSIPLPASIQRISEIPIDDEFLLAFGNNRFWCIQADGSSVRPIYPRSGSYHRRR